MAGPEPYPQQKWTVEQEKAYAEGRRSAQSGQGSAPRSGGKKRVVRTAEGARRYKVPIGAEIGTARNAKAAEAQKDSESTGRYRDLVGQDANAQAKAMAGLNNDQLQRLSMVAYSFPSSDPNVVRLRVGVANELHKRGMNVNDFGGLGGGSARPAGPRRALKKAPPAVAPGSDSTKGIQAAMAKVYGKQRNLSVPQLRTALKAFGRIASDKREVVAKYLVGQAIELGMPQMLGEAVLDASGRRQEVIELAGKWKHGYIPLDAVAYRIKMKGGNGKPWWEGGKQRRVGSKSSMRKSLDAARAARVGRTVPRNKPSSKGEVAKVTGATAATSKPERLVAIPKKGGQRHAVVTEQIKYKGGPRVPGTRMTGPHAKGTFDEGRVPKPRKDFVNNKDTKGRYAAEPRVPSKRTTVVKSSPKPERGSKMNKPELAKHHGVVGKKVTGAPEGTQAYSVTGTSLYDTALFDNDGNLLGFAKKREGYSTVGRSGQATLAKKSGYNMYDRKGNSMGSETTRARALSLIKTRHDRTAGKA